MSQWLLILSPLLSGSYGRELIGILGQSGGDAQACSEVESYSKNLFVDCLLPQTLPEFLRRKIADANWESGSARIMEEYRAVPNDDCNTRLRDMSVLQTQATVAKAQEITGRKEIEAFSGWKFAYGPGTISGTPTVYDALAQMQKAGVTQGFVFDQDGMAYDSRFLGGTYRQIRAYLANHTEWNVTIYGINGFTEQPGYVDLMVAKLSHQVKTEFPNVAPKDLCILLPSQGTPQGIENTTCVGRLRKAHAAIQARLPYNITLAFTNHKPPNSTDVWSQPDAVQKIPEMAGDAYTCRHVLTSPVLQWPQTDYTVYVFQGNGTKDEPGYAKTFEAAGKAYRRVPSWDLVEEGWNGRPPAKGAVPASAVDHGLPDFTAHIVADVLAGKSDKYDLTIIQQNAPVFLQV